ncbi:DUF2800 domain-containing protein [Marinobacter sp.]|uniref:DUF2800 domain-containing protein n=1 Tax=Marinobacter sp. TaxID=50741 RepID=UPI000C95B30D|nr:DUF2800 domain-containing protein [Marinobacter sp.]MAB53555.1 hypothetical protein [Marinobacter sp.]
MHALLAPSAAPRWGYCAGSVVLSALFPDHQSDAAKEGHDAHEVAFAIATGRVRPKNMTREMEEGARLYIDAIQSFNWPSNVWHFEEHTDAHLIHPECGGTPDAWGFHDGTLVIADYKFGHGFVDAVENYQLICYAAGVLPKLDGQQIDRVVFVVVQPRNFHRDGPVRKWEVSYRDLMPHIDHLRTQAEEALGGAPTFSVDGSKQCKYCPGRHACPALQQSAYDACERSDTSLPLVLAPPALALEIKAMQRASDALSARLSGLEEQAFASIRSGKPVPGFAIENGVGRLDWAVPVDQIVKVAAAFGVDISKPAALTPTQAAKAGLDDAVIKQYSQRPAGKIKLVPVNTSRAAKAFGKSESEK